MAPLRLKATEAMCEHRNLAEKTTDVDHVNHVSAHLTEKKKKKIIDS